MAERWVARRSFNYGPEGGGDTYDQGELVELCGLPNDERLIRLGYVAVVSKRSTVVQCGVCGAEFVTDAALAAHGKFRHKGRFLTPEQEDKLEEIRDKREESSAPLYLDKTAASRGSVSSRR